MDEHAFPSLDAKASIDQRERRTARQGHRGGLDVREIRGLARNSVRVCDMELGVRPGYAGLKSSAVSERRGAVDLVAAVPLSDVGSDSVDDAREVGAEDRRQTQVRPGAVGAVTRINRIDARGVHGDPDLPRPGNGVGNVTQLEHAWITEAADYDGAHST